jgi:hypothetical protein
MTEKRHLTPSEIRAISVETRADYQAAVAEAREIGQELDTHSRLKAQAARHSHEGAKGVESKK